MRQVNGLEQLSREVTRSEPRLKREMRTLAMATEKVFPTQRRKETGKGSASDLEWGKG